MRNNYIHYSVFHDFLVFHLIDLFQAFQSQQKQTHLQQKSSNDSKLRAFVVDQCME